MKQVKKNKKFRITTWREFDKPALRKAGFSLKAVGFGGMASVFFIKNKPAIAARWEDEGLTGFSVAKKFRRQGVATWYLSNILDQDGFIDIIEPSRTLLAVIKKIGNVSVMEHTGFHRLVKRST
jgi:hypothetical protein